MSSPVEQMLNEYETSLEKLKNTDSPSTQEVLEPLVARDRIGKQLPNQTSVSADLLIRLKDLDSQRRRAGLTCSQWE